MTTLTSKIIAANPSHVAVVCTIGWNIHVNALGARSNAAKAAAVLLLQYPHCRVFAVLGAIGKGGHTASQIVLLALPVGVELDDCGRWSTEFVA